MNANDLNPVDSINLLMSESRWAEASSKAEEELAKSPERHELLWIAGWANFQLEQYTMAEAHLRKAIDSGHVDHVYYGALGATLLELEKYDEAELWLLRALATRETYPTRIALALVYHKQQLLEVAEAVHREGIRLRPKSRERLEAYADFLSDLGREDEATKIYEDAKNLLTRTST